MLSSNPRDTTEHIKHMVSQKYNAVKTCSPVSRPFSQPALLLQKCTNGLRFIHGQLHAPLSAKVHDHNRGRPVTKVGGNKVEILFASCWTPPEIHRTYPEQTCSITGCYSPTHWCIKINRKLTIILQLIGKID